MVYHPGENSSQQVENTLSLEEVMEIERREVRLKIFAEEVEAFHQVLLYHVENLAEDTDPQKVCAAALLAVACKLESLLRSIFPNLKEDTLRRYLVEVVNLQFCVLDLEDDPRRAVEGYIYLSRLIFS